MGLITSLDEGDLLKIVQPLVQIIEHPAHDHKTVDQIAESIARELVRHQWPSGGFPCDFEPRRHNQNPCCQFNDNAMLSAMKSLYLLHRIMPRVDDRFDDDCLRAIERAWQYVERVMNVARQPGLPANCLPNARSCGFRVFEPPHVQDMHATAHMVLHAREVEADPAMTDETRRAAKRVMRAAGLVRASRNAINLDEIPGEGDTPRYLVDHPDPHNRRAWWIGFDRGDDKYADTYAWRGNWASLVED